MLSVAPHPSLDLKAFITEFPRPLGEISSPADLVDLLAANADAELGWDEAIKPAIRDLLRHGGYRPTGRGKPASEYLRQAVEKGTIGSINLAVDACNVVSYHSGLPISVIDLAKVQPPLSIKIAPSETEYVFNASGQTIKLDGLLCVFDAEGPCGNGVKDSQRTKTSAETMKTLSLIWGSSELAGRSDLTSTWYRELLEKAGARTEQVV